MTMYPATSTNVLAVGYEPSSRTLPVQFRSGGVYDYYGVDPHLFEQMLLPNPWRHRTAGQDTSVRKGRLTGVDTNKEPRCPGRRFCRTPPLGLGLEP